MSFCATRYSSRYGTSWPCGPCLVVDVACWPEAMHSSLCVRIEVQQVGELHAANRLAIDRADATFRFPFPILETPIESPQMSGMETPIAKVRMPLFVATCISETIAPLARCTLERRHAGTSETIISAAGTTTLGPRRLACGTPVRSHARSRTSSSQHYTAASTLAFQSSPRGDCQSCAGEGCRFRRLES